MCRFSMVFIILETRHKSGHTNRCRLVRPVFCCIGFLHIVFTLPFLPLRNGYCTIYFTILAFTYVKFRGDLLRYGFFSILKKPCAIRIY